MKKFLWITILAVLAALAGIGYYRYYWTFGEGVKAGELNFVVRKGYIFKTYEGKLIQSGFRSRTPGSIQSYEFEFSIADPKIAERLMVSGGKEVELHYQEYIKPLPWRGYNKYVVDSIISIRDVTP
ncbi:MAG: hypothetical protein JNL51_15735 [Chitinophagaceae bacterium]|nr:hypothetical protein [Chitinophagaceae bacterium]